MIFFCVFAENSSTSFCVALFSFYIQRLNENGILSVLLLKYTFLHIRGLHCLYFFLFIWKKALNTQTAKKNPLFLFYFTSLCALFLRSRALHSTWWWFKWILLMGESTLLENNQPFFWLKHSEKLKWNFFRFF